MKEKGDSGIQQGKNKSKKGSKQEKRGLRSFMERKSKSKVRGENEREGISGDLSRGAKWGAWEKRAEIFSSPQKKQHNYGKEREKVIAGGDCPRSRPRRRVKRKTGPTPRSGCATYPTVAFQ